MQDDFKPTNPSTLPTPDKPETTTKIGPTEEAVSDSPNDITPDTQPTESDSIVSEAPTDTPKEPLSTNPEPSAPPATPQVVIPEEAAAPPPETFTASSPEEQPVKSEDVVVPVVEKPHRLRALSVAILVLALLGGAVFAAYHFSQPKQQVATTVTKKEVPLLRVGINDSFPTTFYPDVSFEAMALELNHQIFDGLTGVSDNTKIVPALATSWTTPTNTTWLFKLRSNVYFHNGHLLTAQLVKAALDANHDNDAWQSFGTNIKSVDAIDASTVKITTDGPDPLLTNELSQLFIFDTSSAKPNDASNGTGPYTLKSGTEPTEKEIDLTAFNKYWGGKPLTQEVDFLNYDNDDAVIKDLQQNKLDLGNLNDYKSFTKLGSSFRQQTVFAPQVAMLLPNVQDKTSPIAKLAVRQAIYLALDPAKLSAARGDQGTPIGQIVPQEIPGYNPTIKRPANDLTKAKSLLAQAGYPNGFTLPLTYFYTSDDLTTEIKKELAAIGITVTLDRRTDGQQFQTDVFNGKTQISSLAYTTDLLDISDVVNSLITGTENYQSPQLTKLVDEAASQLNPADRLKTLQAMSKLIADDLALMPLYQKNSAPFAVRSDTKLVLKQQVTDTDTGLYFYQVYQK